MRQTFKKILNSTLQARDGKIGHLDDFLFDDRDWTIRYLVVKTGGFLKRERILISPLSVTEISCPNRTIKLKLSQQEVEESPSVDTDLPVFRQMEKQYFDYYRWPYYWDDMGTWGIDPRSSLMIGDSKSPLEQKEKTNSEAHLRSCRIVCGYSIYSQDIRLGPVKDFLIEDKAWLIQNIIAEAGPWPKNRPVMIEPKLVKTISWAKRSLKLGFSKKDFESMPNFKSEMLTAQT